MAPLDPASTERPSIQRARNGALDVRAGADLADKRRVAVHRPSLRQTLTAVGLLVAFGFMASIFVPSASRATGVPRASLDVSGRKLIGKLENDRYAIDIWGTDLGARFTVCDSNGFVLSDLLTAEQVTVNYPDMPIGDAWADVPTRDSFSSPDGPWH